MAYVATAGDDILYADGDCCYNKGLVGLVKDFMRCCMLQGLGVQLRDFMAQLLEWLEQCNVPVRQRAWDLAVAVANEEGGSIVGAARAFEELLHGIQAPVAMLLGEFD